MSLKEIQVFPGVPPHVYWHLFIEPGYMSVDGFKTYKKSLKFKERNFVLEQVHRHEE
jgi:hypothetical protein